MKIRRYPKYRYKSIAFRIICLLLCMGIAVALLDAGLRPAVNRLAKEKAIQIAVAAVNDAVSTVLTDKKVSYADIAEISSDSEGNVTCIATDIIKMNLLKSAVTKEIDRRLNSMGEAKIKVPVGSATGVTLLYGCGPNVTVRLAMTSSTVSDFENDFKAAGFNQTQHSIMLKIKSNVMIILPNYSCTEAVSTDFCIAQTIIVGTVPQVLADVS